MSDLNQSRNSMNDTKEYPQVMPLLSGNHNESIPSEPRNSGISYGNPMDINTSASMINPMGFVFPPCLFTPQPPYMANSVSNTNMPPFQQAMLGIARQHQLFSMQFFQNCQTVATASFQYPGPTTTAEDNRRYWSQLNKSKATKKPKTPLPKLDSPPSSQTEDSDSDCDLDTPKRRKYYGSTMRPEGIPLFVDFASVSAEFDAIDNKDLNSMKNIPAENLSTTKDSFLGKLKSFQEGRKHVWQEAAEQEQLHETVQKMDVVTVMDKFVIERGSESYVVGNKRKRKCPARQTARETVSSEDGFSSNYSSFSDGGISDDTKADLRPRLQAKRAAKPVSSVKDDMKLDDRKERVAKISTGIQIFEEKISTLEEYKVPAYIARKLKEKNVELFVRVWRIFGKEVLLRLFHKTMKIERLGGIMIKNKSRRRTPGGVLLYLLRNDSRLDKEKRAEVFRLRPMKETIVSSQRKNKTLQKQLMFKGIAARMNSDRNLPLEKPMLTDTVHQNFEFEEESNVVPVVKEGMQKLNEKPPEAVPKKPDVSTNVVRARATQQTLVTYNDIC